MSGGDESDAPGAPSAINMEQDIAMTDGPTASSEPQTGSSSTYAASTATTSHNMQRGSDTNGNAKAAATMPTEAAHHGAPTRDWLNTKVTGVLLEGMKLLAAERPEAPLKALGEYLLKKSAELEGTGGAADGANGH